MKMGLRSFPVATTATGMLSSSSWVLLLFKKMVVTMSILLSVTCTVKSCNGFALNKTSHVNVHFPHSLYTPNGMPHRLASFGKFRTQATTSHGTMSMRLYYTDNDLCQWPMMDDNTNHSHGNDPNDNNGGGGNDDNNDNSTNHTVWWSRTEKRDAMTTVTATMKDSFLSSSSPSSSWTSPFFLMADRGNCTFVTKSRHAQMLGAAGLIIADTRCLCSDHECLNQTKHYKSRRMISSSIGDDNTCQTKQPALADDGSGGDVTIPVVMLDKTYGDKVKSELVTKKTPVLLDLKWHPPKATEYLVYSIWMDPLDDYTKDVLKNVAPIVHALGSKIQFVPHVMIHDGTITNCPNDNGDACHQSCTNNGRYCYPSFSTFSGANVVKENLRRLCIWKHYGQDTTTREGGEIWWDYVTYFNDHCSSTNESFASEKCIKEAYKHSHLSKAEEIEDCMKDSGGVDEDTPNALLDNELALQKDYGIYSTPYIWIEHNSFMAHSVRSGSSMDAVSSVPSMLDTICKSFVQDQVPEVCTKCLESSSKTSSDLTNLVNCASKLKPYENNNKGSKKKKKHRGFWTFCFIVFVSGTGGFLYYKKKQSEDPDFSFSQYSLVNNDTSF